MFMDTVMLLFSVIFTVFAIVSRNTYDKTPGAIIHVLIYMIYHPAGMTCTPKKLLELVGTNQRATVANQVEDLMR